MLKLVVQYSDFSEMCETQENRWCLGSDLGLVWLIIDKTSDSFHSSRIGIPQQAGIPGCLFPYDPAYEITNLWQSIPMTFLESNKYNLFSTL